MKKTARELAKEFAQERCKNIYSCDYCEDIAEEAFLAGLEQAGKITEERIWDDFKDCELGDSRENQLVMEQVIFKSAESK